MSVKKYFWTSDHRHNAIVLFGVTIAISVVLIGAIGLLYEAKGLINQLGTSFFVKDAAIRLGSSIVFGVLALTPYLLALKAYKSSAWPRAVFLFTALLFCFDVIQRFHAYFVSESSTSGLIDLFQPILLLTLFLVFWTTLFIVNFGIGFFSKKA